MTDVSKLDDANKALEGLNDAEINKIRDQISVLRKEIEEKSKEAFKNTVKHIFEVYPELESFGWRQYTPYFNDGEPCEFGVYSDVDINGSNPDWGIGEEVDWYSEFLNDGYEQTTVTRGNYSYETSDWSKPINKRPNPHYKPQLADAQKQIGKFINSLDEDALKAMFGDHVHITVYPDRVETEDYDHE